MCLGLRLGVVGLSCRAAAAAAARREGVREASSVIVIYRSSRSSTRILLYGKEARVHRYRYRELYVRVRAVLLVLESTVGTYLSHLDKSDGRAANTLVVVRSCNHPSYLRRRTIRFFESVRPSSTVIVDRQKRTESGSDKD